MGNKLSILLNIPSFRGLSENQLNQIAQIAIEKKCLKGKIIFTKMSNQNLIEVSSKEIKAVGSHRP